MLSSRSLVALLAFAASADIFAQAPAAEPATPPTTQPAVYRDPTIAAPKAHNEKTYNNFISRHEGFLKDKKVALAKGPIQFVLIGDSITDGWRGSGRPVFNTAFGSLNPYNIGISGDQTQHVLWRIDQGELDGIQPNPKVAMIMIGTNNLAQSPESIADGITRIVHKVQEKLPQTKILLLAIFPRDNKPDTTARAKIKTINQTISKLDDGGKTVTYLDIGDKFLAPDGTLPPDVMPDFLHPNAKGYQIWADAVKTTLDGMLK